MRILLINQYAGSPSTGMEYRPHWMAEHWQQMGHEVLIVAAGWSHYGNRELPVASGRATIDGVDFEVLRVLRHEGNGPMRFANILGFAAALRLRTRDLARWRPDVVIASSTHPMDVRPGLTIAKRAGAAFVFEVHDLWPLTPALLGGFSPRHPLIRLMQREEDLACQHADEVVSVIPGTRDYLAGRGMPPQRWTWVSNGVPESAVAGPPPPPPRSDGAFRIGYFGTHGPANDLDTLLAAARILRDEPVRFLLVGEGSEKQRLVSEAADLPSVKFHQRVTPEQARTMMSDMDVLVWGLAPSPLFDHGVAPNKIFDYMAAGRPILSYHASPTPCSEAGCDIAVPGNDPEALADAVRTYLAMSPEQRATLGSRGRRFVVENATQAALAIQMLQVLDRAVSEHRASAPGRR